MSGRAVIPLESNPEIFNELAYKLGLSPILSFHDVYSLTDPDLLAFLPQPIYGVILLFPLGEDYKRYRKEGDANTSYDDDSTINWYKQTIKNGCGFYGLLHLLTNLPQDLIIDNSTLKNFIANSSGLSIEDKVKLVENLEANIKLNENFGTQGQSEVPDANDEITLHFIAFVKGKDDHLYELDGGRSGPLDLGKSVEDNHILNDSKLAEKIQFYMNSADEENRNNFAIMAIGPSLD